MSKIKESTCSGFFQLIFTLLLYFTSMPLIARQADSVLLPVRTLRVALYVFQNDSGQGNFRQEIAGQPEFLHQVVGWVNHRLANLDSLRPAFSSPYVADTRVSIRLDTIYYHRDSRAWDGSGELDSPYMRDRYVDGDSLLDYQEKFQTLPIFLGANNTVIGGHSRNIGDRGYIAARGYFESFNSRSLPVSLDECGRNLIHELGHCLGLGHNFTGGPGGEQCDNCEDNGCPPEGTSNNIMDYWPSYGYALSKCQFNLIHYYLGGGKGNISEVVINDSCYRVPGNGYRITAGNTMLVSDTIYLHNDLQIDNGGLLRVTGYLSMPGETKITLEAGARLEIDGGAIGNLCGDLWLGIRIDSIPGRQPAAVSIINGGRVENAFTGLMASGPVESNLENSIFNNCPEAIVFRRGCADTIRINGCSFRISSKLNHYEEGITPGTFIRAEGIPRLVVTGCRFVNDPGTSVFDADWMGTGLLFSGLSILVSKSEFINLTTGIDLHSTVFDSRAEITGNRFTHNRYGTRSQFAGIQWMSDNTVTLQRFNNGPTVGMLISDPVRFAVNRNIFNSVYGSGRMAGIVINHAGTGNSPVFNNAFTNLPVGIFMNGLPDIEPALFRWAANSETDGDPDLGPQFRYNRFDSVNMCLAAVVDSAFGSFVGTSAGLLTDYDIPATQWATGSFAWYSNQIPMAAFHGWIPPNQKRPDHGLYWFMNYLGIRDSVHQGYPVRDYRWLREYILDIGDIEKTNEWIVAEPVYEALSRISAVPAAVRSARLSGYWAQYQAEDQMWLRKSLASIAERFEFADTLLSNLGTELALRRMEEWNAYQPVNLSDSLIPFTPVPLKGFDFPDLSAFRFGRLPQEQSGLPAFFLYPSPAEDYIWIRPQPGYSFDAAWEGHIISTDGRYSRSIRAESWKDQKVPVFSLPAGIYIIELFSGNQYLGAAKFLKTTNR